MELMIAPTLGRVLQKQHSAACRGTLPVSARLCPKQGGQPRILSDARLARVFHTGLSVQRNTNTSRQRLAATLAADNSPGRGAIEVEGRRCTYDDFKISRYSEKRDPGDTMRTVVLPTAVVLMLCNMDRICMSVAMPAIAREMSWAPGIQGIVQSAFLWGYTVTQILGGSLADRNGGHRVIAYAIAWFSLSSLLLPLAITQRVVSAGWALPAVLACRTLVGLGEGVVMPAMNTLMATRVPASWRSSALGVVYSGFHAGNLAGLALSPLLLVKYGWRSIFYVFGALGLPLLALWHLARQSQPQGQGVATSRQPSEDGTKSVIRVSAQGGSGASARPGPLATSALLAQPAAWAIVVANTVNHWGYFIYLSWLPTYFLEVHGLNLRNSSALAFIPWLVMAIGSSVSGILADRWLASGASVATVRKTFQSIAFAVPAAVLLVLARPHLSLRTAVLCMTLALGGTSLGQAGFVANISDIAPRHAGQLFGLCNTFGCLAAIAGVSTVGFVIQSTGSFSAVFQLTAGLYVIGVLAWISLCRGEAVFD